MKKLVFLLTGLFIFFSSVSLTNVATIAQNDCIGTNYITAEFHAPVESDYTFWLLSGLNGSAPDRIPAIVDDAIGCFNFNPPQSTDLEWTTSQGQKIVQKLSAGTHTIKLSVGNGELNASKILITADRDCIPEGSGDNCLDMNLDIRVDGVQANQTLEKYMQLTTTLSGAELTSPKVEYSFDNSATPFSTATNAPYCLFTANNSCIQGDISFLGDGAHTVTVTISADNMETTTRTIPFVLITNTSLPVPEATTPPPPAPTAPATPTTPVAQDNAIIIGNNTNTPIPTITGSQVVTVAPTTPLSQGDSVTYSVNGNPVATTTISSTNNNPSANLDLKDKDGTAKVSATVNRSNGASETYNAKAKVNNSSQAATKKWLTNGGIRLIATIVSIIIFAVGATYLFKAWKKRREFSDTHNLGSYQYVQPQSNTLGYSLPPVAVMVFAAGLIIHNLAGAAAVRVGVAIDLTRATVPPAYSIVSNQPVGYVTLKDVSTTNTDDTTNPTPPTEQPTVTAGEFYTKNGYIGRDGKRFVAIGVNGVATARTAYQNPGQWWNDTGMGTMNGRGQQYKSFGFNFVRLNDMRDYSQFSFDDYQNGLFDTIDEYTSLGITCMPTYHQRGPGTNPTPEQLTSDSTYQDYWTGIIERYKSNPNIWINPINEPIGTAWDQWESISNYQYNLMRSKGWEGIVVIDLPQWAQNINIGTDRLVAFVEGKYNIVIGFHNYDMGNQTNAVTAAQAAGVPILIGEYGETLSGNNHDSQVWVSDNAYTLGIGAVAWWGAGNREDDYVLRQQVGSTWYDTSVPLNEFGQRLFDLAANPEPQPSL